MFRRNHAAARELLAGKAYQQLRQAKAREIVNHARSLAPDGGPSRGYRETLRFTVVDGVPRAESTDAFAHLIEYGSAKNPPYAPLRRAARAAGLDLREDAKGAAPSISGLHLST